MAKYIWNDHVLTVDFETEGLSHIVVDVDKLPEAVQTAGRDFGVQVGLRNSTAGKMQDEPAEAHKLMTAKLKLYSAGTWVAEGEAKAKIVLSDGEKDAIIGDVIIKAKQAKGDKRTPVEILEAFTALPPEQKSAAIASLRKLIDKRFAAALRDRKSAAKADPGNW